MLEKWLFEFTANKPCRIIKRGPGMPYLERYFLFKRFGFTCYLHRFVEPDRDEEVHNHPFSALAICLAGWYMEQRLSDADFYKVSARKEAAKWRKVKPGSFNFIRAGGLLKGDFHRIVDLRRNTWTLFIHRERVSSWGFLRFRGGVWCFDHYKRAIEETFGTKEAVVGDRDWWKTFPVGKDAGREPM